MLRRGAAVSFNSLLGSLFEASSAQFSLTGSERCSSVPREVLEHGQCLLIEFFLNFGWLGLKRQTLEFHAERGGSLDRKSRYQEPYDPILPNEIIGVEDLADVRNKRFADRLEDRSQNLRNRPVGVLQPLNEIANDGRDRRKAGCRRRVSACDVAFVFRYKFADVHGSACPTYRC
jgi:hypothetical protein